jgi:hypothetical protein
MSALRAGVSISTMRRCLLFARSASLVSIALGVLVLVGWALGIGVLESSFPGLAPMKPFTAISFIFLGCALLLRLPRFALTRGKGLSRHTLAQACALFPFLVGLVTLSEYAFDLKAGIDELLFREAVRAANVPFPGRMSHVTALALMARRRSTGFQPFRPLPCRLRFCLPFSAAQYFARDRIRVLSQPLPAGSWVDQWPGASCRLL